jgi:hypothetical protein
MAADQIDTNPPADEEPTRTLPSTGTPPAPASPSVVPSVPPTTATTLPAPAEPAPRKSSRGWLIAGAAVGGVVVLGLTFGGGIATGFALDGGLRGGPAAGPDGRGFPGAHGDRGWGEHGQQRPEQGTPPQRQGDDDSGDDGVTTPTPTPES